ncbi:MAG: Terminase small subunit [Mesorhizobium sp.]|nr:MAG: Terminase small subunit [Mesorhizobium sp.]TIQ49152.1 MAG: Terminase small subunit [Mesorhizobium sp.]TIQ58911.1 MAG: Terminase small subunit [Mesorhizobium sp.]
MPRAKLNMRQERFCLGLAEGLPQSRAYIEAGYTARDNAAEVNAARLLRKAQVKSRLEELQAGHAQRTAVTVESLVAELEEARAAALAHKQLAAAVAASLGKAKLLGLIVDRAEVESVIRKPMREPGQVEQMTLEEWQEKFAPKPLDQQSGNDAPATEPVEPEEEISILENIRRAKEARRGKTSSLHTGFGSR